MKNNTSSEEIQTLLYEVGKSHDFENLKDFFKLVYQVLLGQEKGPRLGSFIKLFEAVSNFNSDTGFFNWNKSAQQNNSGFMAF